jgi:hypothetical protein
VQSEPRSLHKYLYAHADPVNGSDPSGLLRETSIAASRIVPGFARAAGLEAGLHTSIALARQFLAPAIRCALFATAGYIGLPTAGLRPTKIDETCKVLGEAYGVYEEYQQWANESNKSKTSSKRTLYRGEKSSIGPEIVFTTGLTPKGSNPDLIAHVFGTPDSGYVATTKKIEIASYFAGKNGWIYIIRTDRGTDVNEILGDKSPYPEQEEVAFYGGVYPREIVGAFDIRNYRITSFIKNPFFQEE